MKILAALAAASIAIVSAETPSCDVAHLLPAISGANGAACLAETQYTPATLQIPAGDALVKVCSSKNCTTLFADMDNAVPTECLLAGLLLRATFLDRFGPPCAAALNSTTTTTTNL